MMPIFMSASYGWIAEATGGSRKPRVDRQQYSTIQRLSPFPEQRANAFAAMLLMPLDRLTLQADSEDVESLQSDVRRLTRKLEVSRTALIRHLANISKISGAAMETLLASMNLIACRDRVTSSMQHEHLGREPADDQVLPTGFSDGCARGLVQKGAR
jgi:hypothetical protein